MTDQEIIQGLLDRDNRITHQFFFVKCRPLVMAIMRLVFPYPVEYDEMVNEFYEYMLADDGVKLRQFQFRSTIYQWMKVVATRFFISHRDSMIDDNSKEPHYEKCDADTMIDTVNAISQKIDIEKLLQLMENQRYADAIRNLVLDDMEPWQYAAQIGVTVDNLYNIKKRAMTALTRIAIKYYNYER